MLNLPLFSFTGKLTKPWWSCGPSSQLTGMAAKLKPATLFFFECFFCVTFEADRPARGDRPGVVLRLLRDGLGRQDERQRQNRGYEETPQV